MFDTHVNLHGERYSDDLVDVLARAETAGVTRMISICDRLDSLPEIRQICASRDNIWYSVGVHPHHAKDYQGLSAQQLVDLAKPDDVVAIGETGLDFHYGYSAEDDQLRCLHAHIEAARETDLPLIIHTREADDLMGDTLEAAYREAPFQILLHCYTSGQRLLDRGLEMGAYVSASGIVSFKTAHDVRAVIDTVPMDRLILETDCPFLSPMPMRGRRNEPAYLPYVAKAVATLKNMDAADVGRMTEANALRLFSRIPA